MSVRLNKKRLWVITGILLALCILGGLFLAGKANWMIYALYHPDKADNPDAVAVSYAELQDFLDGYSIADYPDDWDCAECAIALHDDAEREGIKAAIIVVRNGALHYHVITVFETTDRGLVYADAMVG